jgi:hypothetical protein
MSLRHTSAQLACIVLVQVIALAIATEPVCARQAASPEDQRTTPRPSGPRKVVRRPIFDLEAEAARARDGQMLPGSMPRASADTAPVQVAPLAEPARVGLVVVTREKSSNRQPAVTEVPPPPVAAVPAPSVAARSDPSSMHPAPARAVIAADEPARTPAGLGDWWKSASGDAHVQVVMVEGDADQAQWRPSGASAADKWRPLTRGAVADGNMELRTGMGVKVVLRVGDGAEVRIAPLTRVGLGKTAPSDGEGALCIGLARGKVEVLALKRDEFSLSSAPIHILSPEGRYIVQARTVAARDAFAGRTTLEPTPEATASVPVSR